ncbi:MAG: phosphotransferase [Dehalococcoidia bacterium]|nr:phosphotransferase [Dehalococcoidia bacterium]
MIRPELLPRLRAALPHADLGRASPLGEGWGTVAYRVPDPGGDWALRMRRGESFRAVTGDLEREVHLLPLLESEGLPTPREARAISDASGDLIATAHRLIEGGPATRSRLGRGTRRERLAGQLGDFLTRLHAVPLDDVRETGVKEIDLWAERYAPLFAESAPRLGPGTQKWLDALEGRFLAESGMRGAPRTLVHGDIAPEHIRLAEDGSLSGVIDFGDALIADPALDLGGLLLAHGSRFTEQVMAHYGGEVDSHFWRRMRFYVDAVPIFLVQFGHLFNEGQDERDGRRQFAARAAAATRRARIGPPA